MRISKVKYPLKFKLKNKPKRIFFVKKLCFVKFFIIKFIFKLFKSIIKYE